VNATSNSDARSTSTDTASSRADLLEQLKAHLEPPLLTEVSGKFAAYENELQYAKLKIQLLEEKLRLQRIAKYGPGSEKLSNLQLELLELEPGVSNTEVAAESEREALPSSSEEKKKRRKHPGRQTLPADLARVERVIGCTPEQCVCGGCGGETKVIGYDVSEVLDVKPAEYFVQVTKREKRACKTCEEQGVAMAPLPVRIIDKSLVSDRIIIDTIVSKYADHNPLYRQSVIFLRDAGINISRATMCGWVMTVGEMLAPVVGAMRRQLLAGSYIQADETTVDVQMHDRSGKNHQAYLWQYSTPGGATIFDFRMSFSFLGFEFRRVLSFKGKWRPQYTPRLKKRTALLGKLKEIFRRYVSQPVELVITLINPILRGWVNYFAVGDSGRSFSLVKDWVEKKVRRHLMRAQKRKGFGWKRWSKRWLYEDLKLFNNYRVKRDGPLPKVVPAR